MAEIDLVAIKNEMANLVACECPIDGELSPETVLALVARCEAAEADARLSATAEKFANDKLRSLREAAQPILARINNGHLHASYIARPGDRTAKVEAEISALAAALAGQQ